jgi:hypothetical protein
LRAVLGVLERLAALGVDLHRSAFEGRDRSLLALPSEEQIAAAARLLAQAQGGVASLLEREQVDAPEPDVRRPDVRLTCNSEF